MQSKPSEGAAPRAVRSSSENLDFGVKLNDDWTLEWKVAAVLLCT